jgi:hypothetical protein
VDVDGAKDVDEDAEVLRRFHPLQQTQLLLLQQLRPTRHPMSGANQLPSTSRSLLSRRTSTASMAQRLMKSLPLNLRPFGVCPLPLPRQLNPPNLTSKTSRNAQLSMALLPLPLPLHRRHDALIQLPKCLGQVSSNPLLHPSRSQLPLSKHPRPLPPHRPQPNKSHQNPPLKLFKQSHRQGHRPEATTLLKNPLKRYMIPSPPLNPPRNQKCNYPPNPFYLISPPSSPNNLLLHLPRNLLRRLRLRLP